MEAPADLSADTTTICGENKEGSDAGYYEFQWHHGFSRVTTNENGTTGWANVIHCTNPSVKVGGIRRFHMCKHEPCRAWWTASKYGEVGPPTHLQQVRKRIAVAESPGSPAVPSLASAHTAVAGPSTETSPLAAEPAPVGPAPALEELPAGHPANTGTPTPVEIAPVEPAPALEPAPVGDPANTGDPTNTGDPASLPPGGQDWVTRDVTKDFVPYPGSSSSNENSPTSRPDPPAPVEEPGVHE